MSELNLFSGCPVEGGHFTHRFCAHHDLMMVHSFSQSHEWFEDYSAFTQLYGVTQEPNELSVVKKIRGKFLYLAWVTGEAEYLGR